MKRQGWRSGIPLGGRNQLHTTFERHFDQFCDVYDERDTATCGMFRLDRIRDIGERFVTCGDCGVGVARIWCTNPTCGHCRNRRRFCLENATGVLQTTFRPFSCKGFYLCPSCSQKRTLLFAEHLTNEILLEVRNCAIANLLPSIGADRLAWRITANS